MNILGLDLSTHSGWALLNDKGDLLHKGIIERKPVGNQSSIIYPINFIDMANSMAFAIKNLIRIYGVDWVVIEETNQMARNRYDQKKLEFIHFAVNTMLFNEDNKIERFYLSTSEWKKLLHIRMTKEDKAHNKLVREKKAKGKITGKHLSVREMNTFFDLELLIKDNDIADALALVSAILIKNGLLGDEKWIKQANK